jgi:uncharacterized coiled-coil protein SlyX
VSTIDERVDNLENRMSTVEATLERIATAQAQNQEQLNTLTQRLDGVTQRLDSFIYESQRIARNISAKAERNEAGVETLRDATANLLRSISELRDEARADRAEFRAQNQRTDSMISRLDALVDYLMRNG